MVIKFGIIGYRNHAKRLIDIIEQRSDCIVSYIYHPSKSINDSRATNDLSKLFNCDTIVIASPNSTHYDYIQKLGDFSGYILCEKPPAISLEELDKIEKLPKQRKAKLFFNFNYRFSNLSEKIGNYINSEELGKIAHIEIIATQGLAFKKEYLNSWRADGKENMHNLLDTVTIHYLDLVNFHLTNNFLHYYFPRLLSSNGTSYDTNLLILQYEDGPTISILNSYATSYMSELLMIGTNGYLSIRNGIFEICSPRDTFDEKGFFISPLISHHDVFQMQEDYNMSLKKSLDYFITKVKENNDIDLDHFYTSISTTRLLFKIKNNLSN